MSGVLRVIMISIADVVGKPPTESVFFEKYARIASVIDEVVNEVSSRMAKFLARAQVAVQTHWRLCFCDV